MQHKFSKRLAKTRRRTSRKCRRIERKRRKSPSVESGIYRCP